jgi:hypothetical protein
VENHLPRKQKQVIQKTIKAAQIYNPVFPFKKKKSSMKPQMKTLILALTGSLSVNGQTLAQDCAVIQSIWQALGQSTAIPSNCCTRDFGIVCEGSRLTRLYTYFILSKKTYFLSMC